MGLEWSDRKRSRGRNRYLICERCKRDNGMLIDGLCSDCHAVLDSPDMAS